MTSRPVLFFTALLLLGILLFGVGAGAERIRTCGTLKSEAARIENVAQFNGLFGDKPMWEPGEREEYDGRYAALLKLGTELGCL